MIIVFINMYIHRGAPWKLINLISAIILIMSTAVMIGLIGDLLPLAEIFLDRKLISVQELNDMKRSGGLWMVVFPMMAGGVGVNALYAFLTTKKPPDNTTKSD